MKFLKQINEGLEKSFTSNKLDEAMPKDLMKQIQQTTNYKRMQNQAGGLFNKWDPEKREYVPNAETGVKDYANASYQELTPQQVLAMRKNGEDLSNIYVIDNNNKMVRLNSVGNPAWDDNEYTADVRSNQSLKKTLSDAKKIYQADIKDLMDSDPEKAFARLGNAELRKANRDLGKNRPNSRYGADSRRKSDYVKKIQARAGQGEEIAKIKAAYEEGDISRKEMERQIDSIKNSWRSTPSEWDIRDYNNIRNKNAEARYKASEQSLQQPFDELKDARSTLYYAKNDLESDLNRLDAIKNGATENSTYYSDYLEAKKEVEKITQQIAALQNQLTRYQQKIDNGAQNKDIEKYEKQIADSEAKIANSQATINRLLRRTESLKRRSDRLLNESLKKKSNK